MTDVTDAGRRGAARAQSRLSKALIGLLMKRAMVASIDDVADGFRIVTLEGAALRSAVWLPGQKVQVAMNSAFVARTYTPIEWDAATGRTRIVGYAHGEGPGSGWLRGLDVGDECDLFGPRGSLDARPLAGPLAVFGDETSIGLGYALGRQDHSRSVSCYLEVGDRADAEQVGTALDLGNITLFTRRRDDAHLVQMEAALPSLIAAGASFVLTGKAGTVQRLRVALKRHDVPAQRIATKAYWAPGKTGLD